MHSTIRPASNKHNYGNCVNKCVYSFISDPTSSAKMLIDKHSNLTHIFDNDTNKKPHPHLHLSWPSSRANPS